MQYQMAKTGRIINKSDHGKETFKWISNCAVNTVILR